MLNVRFIIRRIRCIIKDWHDKRQRCGPFLLEHYIHGKFRVRYQDGNVSVPFDYKTACDYAKIFGGEVIRREEHIEQAEEVFKNPYTYNGEDVKSADTTTKVP